MSLQMRYYRIHDDMYFPGRWHLKMPVDSQGEWIDTWQFKEGKVVDVEGPIRVPVKQAGVVIEFSHSLGIPIVHRRVISLFERLGIEKEVQFIPVEVEGQVEPWFILNALQVIQCIDESRCEEVGYWLPEDERPDKVGQYKKVVGLKVDPTKVGAAHVFRPWGWKVVLIVSERVKQAMEAEGITGTDFVEV
jgi:hypothetical protein